MSPAHTRLFGFRVEALHNHNPQNQKAAPGGTAFLHLLRNSISSTRITKNDVPPSARISSMIALSDLFSRFATLVAPRRVQNFRPESWIFPSFFRCTSRHFLILPPRLAFSFSHDLPGTAYRLTATPGGAVFLRGQAVRHVYLSRILSAILSPAHTASPEPKKRASSVSHVTSKMKINPRTSSLVILPPPP